MNFLEEMKGWLDGCEIVEKRPRIGRFIEESVDTGTFQDVADAVDIWDDAPKSNKKKKKKDSGFPYGKAIIGAGLTAGGVYGARKLLKNRGLFSGVKNEGQ